MTIGPGTINFNPLQAPLGTKLLMLHFQNINFLPGDQLQVNLGYDIDVFTAASGSAFWTRPVNVYAFPGGVPIAYVAAGLPGGSVQLDQFGRGERHNGEPIQPQPASPIAIRSIRRPLTRSRNMIRSGTAMNHRTGTTWPVLHLLLTYARG